MEALLSVDYIPEATVTGRKENRLAFSASAGENVLLLGSAKRCRLHFLTLCGLRRPDGGVVTLGGRNVYEMTGKEAAAFRRDAIGAVPRGLGLIPELSLLDQIALPGRLAGMEEKAISERIRGLTSEMLPMHDLYNLPARCSLRKQTCAAMLRAVFCSPRIIVMDGCLEEGSDLDRDALWRAFAAMRPKGSVFVYLCGGTDPAQMPWTLQISV